MMNNSENQTLPPNLNLRGIVWGLLAGCVATVILLLVYLLSMNLRLPWTIAIGAGLCALALGWFYRSAKNTESDEDLASDESESGVMDTGQTPEERQQEEWNAIVMALEARVEALRESLVDYPRRRMPLKWAEVMDQIGRALLELGIQEVALLGRRMTGKSNVHLKQAAASFQKSLAERTLEKAPKEWAATQLELGTVLLTLGERGGLREHLETALTAFTNAQLVLNEADNPQDIARAQELKGRTQAVLDELPPDISELSDDIVLI